MKKKHRTRKTGT